MLRYLGLLLISLWWVPADNLSAMTVFHDEPFYIAIYSACPIQSISGSYRTGKST